jgi:hypothetical protein
MKKIIHLAIHPGKDRLEKTLTTESLGGKSLLVFPSESYDDFPGIRTENSDSQIVADSMRPKDPERIGMRAGEKNIELVYGQTGYFERTHARTAILEPLGKMSCADFGRIQESDAYL